MESIIKSIMKKIIAAILTAVMILGIAGCNTGGVDDVMKEYTQALRKIDEEKVLALTVFEESDPEAQYIRDCFCFDGNASYIWEVYKAVASTITLDYKSSDIVVSGDTAVVDFEYSIVDWEPLFKKRHLTADDLVKAINTSTKTKTIEGSLVFNNVEGQWKITKITNLDELYAFSDDWPLLDTKQWPTIPAWDS